MNSNQKHCESTFELYGVTGKDIHEWIDAPVILMAGGHRKKRHHHGQELPKKFIERYGTELANNIMIDHLLRDEKSSRQKRLHPDKQEIQAWRREIEYKQSQRDNEQVIYTRQRDTRGSSREKSVILGLEEIIELTKTIKWKFYIIDQEAKRFLIEIPYGDKERFEVVLKYKDDHEKADIHTALELNNFIEQRTHSFKEFLTRLEVLYLQSIKDKKRRAPDVGFEKFLIRLEAKG